MYTGTNDNRNNNRNVNLNSKLCTVTTKKILWLTQVLELCWLIAIKTFLFFGQLFGRGLSCGSQKSFGFGKETVSTDKFLRKWMSFWCLYCQPRIYFIHYFSVSIPDFEQINSGWGQLLKRKHLPKVTKRKNWQHFYANSVSISSGLNNQLIHSQ